MPKVVKLPDLHIPFPAKSPSAPADGLRAGAKKLLNICPPHALFKAVNPSPKMALGQFQAGIACLDCLLNRCASVKWKHLKINCFHYLLLPNLVLKFRFDGAEKVSGRRSVYDELRRRTGRTIHRRFSM
jgi:hypothetical protein